MWPHDTALVPRRPFMLLFFLRAEHDDHALSLKHRHLLYFAVFLKIIGKTQKKHLSLFLEKDRAALEEHIGFYLRAFLEEALGVLELEVVVMVIGLRAETYFLDYDLCCLFLLLFLAFFLLIEEFLIIDNATYRRLGGCGDLHKIKLQLVGDAACLLNREYSVFNVVTHKSHLTGMYALIDRMKFLLFLSWYRTSTHRTRTAESAGTRTATLIRGTLTGRSWSTGSTRARSTLIGRTRRLSLS